MSDDIVTRLRGYWDCSCLNVKEHGLYRKCVICEAADEIERLRQLADNFYKTMLYYSCQCNISPCKCGYDDMMDEYKEGKTDE